MRRKPTMYFNTFSGEKQGKSGEEGILLDIKGMVRIVYVHGEKWEFF